MATIRQEKRYVPDGPVNLLPTLASPIPFVPPDPPPPRRTDRYAPDNPPNLQTSTFYVAGPSPFLPPDLPTPQRKMRYVPDIPPTLSPTISPPSIPPDLPTPQRKQRYVPDVPPNLQTSTFYVPGDPPFVPPDLPTPRRSQFTQCYVPDIPNNYFTGASGPTPPPHPPEPGAASFPWGFPSIPRDPVADPRMRRFTEALSDIVNSLLRRGFIREVSPGRWALEIGQWESTRDPSVNDSVLIGVRRGDMWFNTVTNTAFINLANTAGAPVWKQITCATGVTPNCWGGSWNIPP